MKITINGKVPKDALKSILEEQKEKTKFIEDYCKKQKIDKFFYKDAELEYEYIKITQTRSNKKEVETRWTKKKQGLQV